MQVSFWVAKSAIQRDTRTHGSGCSISADPGAGTQVDTCGYTRAIPYDPRLPFSLGGLTPLLSLSLTHISPSHWAQPMPPLSLGPTHNSPSHWASLLSLGPTHTTPSFWAQPMPPLLLGLTHASPFAGPNSRLPFSWGLTHASLFTASDPCLPFRWA